jgi:DNA-binding HxlR family transcriptional regulator
VVVLGGFGGDVTILGRSFGLHILEALRERRETSFSGLMEELGMNRATLSRTLGDLMNHGYVERRAYGRHRYYTATKKGLRKLEELKRPELTEDRIVQLVYRSLGERGVLERYPEVTREAVLQATRSATLAMMKSVRKTVEEELRGKRNGRERPGEVSR